MQQSHIPNECYVCFSVCHFRAVEIDKMKNSKNILRKALTKNILGDNIPSYHNVIGYTVVLLGYNLSNNNGKIAICIID